jgi:hypothetical protein
MLTFNFLNFRLTSSPRRPVSQTPLGCGRTASSQLVATAAGCLGSRGGDSRPRRYHSIPRSCTAEGLSSASASPNRCCNIFYSFTWFMLVNSSNYQYLTLCVCQLIKAKGGGYFRMGVSNCVCVTVHLLFALWCTVHSSTTFLQPLKGIFTRTISFESKISPHSPASHTLYIFQMLALKAFLNLGWISALFIVNIRLPGPMNSR